ncbi:uncharacterized protein LOC122057831 isoform X2 [Macadamia integrifolia]|uniref:uncharacterized protein LOC122057831 isoform X2 n=1 Tax=Macadamia integrifolia TaxID=60698 RepID=UPI001C52C061|nr:uncharacterized protein LOC122057831 isoform X2 [Macadamia integrifolia]
MYGNRQQSFVSEMVSHSGGDTSITPSDKENTLMCKFQVEEDGSFLCASEDDVMEVEHLFVEPKNDKVLVDNILCFNPDIPGTQDSNTTQGGKVESKFEFLDGVLNGVDGEGDLHITNVLSTMCDEYLLGSCLGDMGLESQSSEWSGRNCHTPVLSELSTSTIPVPESSSDPNARLLDKISLYDLHETFRSTFGRETSVSDKQWLKRRISFGLQNLVELENVSSLLECGVQTNENEGNIFTSCSGSSGRMRQLSTDAQGSKIRSLGRGVEGENLAAGVELVTTSTESGNVGVELLDLGDGEGLLLRRKRLRKPTRRYIEESSALKSRCYSGKLDTPMVSSRDKFLPDKSHSQHQRKGFGAPSLVCRQDYLGGSGIQVPFGLRARKGRPKKSRCISGYDCDSNKEDELPSVPHRNSVTETAAESQDDISDDCVPTIKTVKRGMRRKHHRLWTLSEVIKLIDGVSRYGVGRWTEIKRLLFSSSAYRTSVDLKDKWRNLLRASCAQLQSKREVEGRKNACRPIPQSVLRRVSELAIIYPYPRQRKSNLSFATPIAAPITSAPNSDTPMSRSGRIVHRKSQVLKLVG